MALALAGVLLWWVPSAMLSGGAAAYLAALISQTERVASAYSVPANGLEALAYNTAFTVEGLGWGLGLFAIPIALAVARLARDARRRRIARPDRLATGLILWAIPALVFYGFVHIGEWGYVLSVLPALFLGSGLLLERVHRVAGSRRWIASGAAAILVPAFVFLGGDDAYAGVSGGARFSAAAIRGHDAGLAARIGYVRSHFPTSGTVILARDDYQLVRYYLPEYRAWYWDPDPYSPRSAKRKRAMRPTTIVVFTAGLQPLLASEIRRVEIVPGIDLAYLPLEPGSVLELAGERYVVREPPGR
jgi:hypothetical protein